jgi:DNA-binding beta-propeller fold protein YncE
VTASAPIPEPSPCPLVWQLNTGLRYPRELALSHNNDLLFCTDCHNHRVVVISTSDGQPLSAFGTKTVDETSAISDTDDTISFKFPWALAFSDSCPSHLWVSEYGSAQLQCFDISAYQFAFSSLRCCSPTSFSQKFNAPTPPLNVQPTRLRVLSLPDCSMGIAVSDGRLFASSISKHCIRVFDELNLASLGEIPNAGNRGLCVDSQRRLVYCCYDVKPQNDKIDGAVTIHSSTPPFAFQSAITSVYNAYGVCVEPVSGCLYVTERWSNRVSLVIAP